MCQEAVRKLCNPSESSHVRKVARLLARPLRWPIAPKQGEGSRSGTGLDSAWWFFLAFGEEVRQAGSREQPVDHRGCLCQTPAPCCPPPSCWISSGFVTPKTPSP